MCRPRIRGSRSSLLAATQSGSAAVMLLATTALVPVTAFAQEQAAESNHDRSAITVTGLRDKDEAIDLGAKEIQRRDTSNMGDLVESISGLYLNSLYSRPDVAVGIQGIAGQNRITQQIEGISQSFSAFSANVAQTGSIFIDPMLLAGIDVTRGGSVGTGTLGGLGASVNFRYMDVDDVVKPGRSIGGVARLSTGVGGRLGNGQRPAGSAFLAGRTGGFEWLAGGAYSDNDDYRVGSGFDTDAMQNNFHANNMTFFRDGGSTGLPEGDCRYQKIIGIYGGAYSGFENCQLTAQNLKELKQAAKSSALEGTKKRTYSGILRLRYDFGDDHNQKLDLFAVTSGARYFTEQAPRIMVPTNDDGSNGTAYWGDDPWTVRTRMSNTVASLKYSGEFSQIFNPTVQGYYENQRRKQNWLGTMGSMAMNQPLHYDVKNESFGIKLDNTTHFSTAFTGPMRFDIGVDLRRMNKTVDSLSEQEYYANYLKTSFGIDYPVPKWDPDSRNDSVSAAFSLSTEGDGPLQVTAGAGWQHIRMSVYDPRYMTGNQAKAGTDDFLTKYLSLLQSYQDLGQSYSDATTSALADLDGYSDQFSIVPGAGSYRYTSEDEHHDFNLKSAHLSVQYTLEGSGLSAHAQVNYSERAPTSNEMYMAGVYNFLIFTANPDLKPEKNLSLQLGVDYARSGLFTSSDRLKASVLFYRNRITDYIDYGPIIAPDSTVSDPYGDAETGAHLLQPAAGGMAAVNDRLPFIRQGFEFNLDYHQPLFNLRGNLTVPLRHDNKICSWYSPSGRAYGTSSDATGLDTIYTNLGHAGEVCYSGWNWMQTSLIQPITSTFTATLTPMGDKLELGGTAHYRGRQRAAYWYNSAMQTDVNRYLSTQPIPDGDGWLVANLFPSVMKFDLFASYKVNDNLKLGVYASNITNRMDAQPTTFGYNFYPGRMLKANLEARF
ncbi:TonB-dependent receptor [Novosphingobium sp. BL-8A]|uniref:TonB-dependent receptor domain-containing protein n=1 Tax=Novosphingobium sp. BL-8A TaxID=3127639 RepID=UPI0037582631